jgi:8-oxo-dGTP diphosphatase
MSQVFAAMKAVIEHNGTYLALKQKVGEEYIYDLPGGKVDFGESPYLTLHREVKEEVDLEIEIIKPLGVWWFFRKKDGHQVVCSTFLCKPKTFNVDITKNPVLTERIESVEWLSKEELLEKISEKSLKDLILSGI